MSPEGTQFSIKTTRTDTGGVVDGFRYLDSLNRFKCVVHRVGNDFGGCGEVVWRIKNRVN